MRQYIQGIDACPQTNLFFSPSFLLITPHLFYSFQLVLTILTILGILVSIAHFRGELINLTLFHKTLRVISLGIGPWGMQLRQGRIYQSTAFNICHYSMEIQKNLINSSLKTCPVRPLEGYFRFRQEMMKQLPVEERTSQKIIGLWNQLSAQQKAVRLQQTLLHLHQYQMELARWNNHQQIPLQTILNPFNQTNFQNKIQSKSWEHTAALQDMQNSTHQNSKGRSIKKLNRKISKKQKKQ